MWNDGLAGNAGRLSESARGRPLLSDAPGTGYELALPSFYLFYLFYLGFVVCIALSALRLLGSLLNFDAATQIIEIIPKYEFGIGG